MPFFIMVNRLNNLLYNTAFTAPNNNKVFIYRGCTVGHAQSSLWASVKTFTNIYIYIIIGYHVHIYMDLAMSIVVHQMQLEEMKTVCQQLTLSGIFCQNRV